jgi:hypothetical protein
MIILVLKHALPMRTFSEAAKGQEEEIRPPNSVVESALDHE